MTTAVGEMLITRWEDDSTMEPRLRIDRADPTVWIHDEMVRQLERGQHIEAVRYDAEHRALTINGMNRTVVYRITDTYDAEHKCWLMVWPD